MKGRYLVPLALCAALLSGCTVAVSGVALPAASTDPCSLLTDAEAASLGLQGPGTPQPAQPQFHTPPSCTWSPSNPDAVYSGSLQAFSSADLPISAYYTTAPAGVERFGGIDWTRYPSPVADFICNLAVPLSDSSFVALSSQDLADADRACDLAKDAAPLVGAHLPILRGGR